jgi:NitT/TauT family transport system substrate-binding protein
MLKKISPLALLFVFLLQLLPAFAQDKIKLRVSSATKTLGYGPLWVASRMGFFDRQGLDVDLVVIRASDVGIQALAGGSLEIAGAPPMHPLPQSRKVWTSS